MQAHELLTKIPFDITSVETSDDGWANIVLTINHEWIFRFSRQELTHAQMRLENAFYTQFQNHSTVNIPQIRYFGPGFMGYKKLLGKPLTKYLFETLETENKLQIYKDLGTFLTNLHTTHFTHPDLKEFPYGGEHFWEDLWTPVAPHLSENTRRNAQNYFVTYFNLIKNSPPSKTITHCDLGTSNILYDESSGKLSIIDFGDLCLHDPARDFNGLLRKHGREFTEKVVSEYQGELGEFFWERVDFYSKRNPFMIHFYSPLFKHPEYQSECIKQIEELFQS